VPSMNFDAGNRWPVTGFVLAKVRSCSASACYRRVLPVKNDFESNCGRMLE
jgi:hypothetical protein